MEKSMEQPPTSRQLRTARRAPPGPGKALNILNAAGEVGAEAKGPSRSPSPSSGETLDLS